MQLPRLFPAKGFAGKPLALASPSLRVLAVLLGGVVSSNISEAQTHGIEFKHLTVSDGISHSQVNAIVQDNQGFMWFGTRAGLDRYDGYGCKVMAHNPDDSSSLSGDFILSLYVTRDGRLWIGTQGRGLDCYDPLTGKISVYRREFGPSVPNIVCLLEDSGGILWAGTTNGLYRVVRDSSRVLLELFRDRGSDSLEGERPIRAIYEDRRGTLWIGTDQRVKCLPRENRARGEFIAYPNTADNPGSPGEGIVHGITSDKEGGIWVGTRRGSVRRLDVATGKVERFLKDVQERSLHADLNGDIWVGTLDQGLFKISDPASDHPGLVHYRNEPDNPGSLGGNEVGCICEDRAGRIWIGTNGAGISIIDPLARKFIHYHHVPNNPASLSNDIVKALARDANGNVWVGTYGGGLNLLKSGTRKIAPYSLGSADQKDNLVTSVLARRNGEVWASFSFSGLLRILPSSGRQIRYKHSPGDTTGLVGINVIRTMYEDSRGSVWIGTHGFGVLRYDQSIDGFTRFSSIPGDSTSLSGNHVWSIFEDHQGYIWFGMWRYGLNRLDPQSGRVRRFDYIPSDSTSISDHPVLCMAEDLQGRLWIGTAGGGLQMLDVSSGRFTRFHEGKGFPDNFVYGILTDDHGFLWTGTGSGLVRFDPTTRKFWTFDVNDGVQGSEFSQGAFCKGADGRMFFGGINGFNEFHPDSIILNPTPPPVVITRFVVFDREIPLPRSITATREIALERNQDFFSFEFAALDFTAPVKNRYKYRLQGFDRDWINAGSRRLASYTNVGPGTYLFQVKGSNNDGVWNEDGAAIAVKVRPAPWETWWFRSMIVAMLAGMAYSLYHYRVNKLLAIQRTRERIARDLHDEVSAILSGISYFSRAVHEDSGNTLSDRSAHFMSLIHRSSSEVLELLHDIIWSINPEGDRLDNIAAKLRRYASDLCESRSIRYAISIPEALPLKSVGPDTRKNFWLIYKEMVTNAVRHSGCSELSIRLGLNEDGTVHLHVSDNGRGFNSDGRSGRNGLKNINARAAALNARVVLDTAPGKGTRWDLHCSLVR